MRKNGIAKIINRLCFFSLFILANVTADELMVADFSSTNLEGWYDKIFTGITSYQIIKLENQNVLMAYSQGSASGLVKNMHVDIKIYPYLNWRWRIENRLDIKNEKIKSSDDYAARVYVIIDGGIFPWRTKAINYVWANGVQEGEIWPNAFVGKNAMMMALRSKQDETSTWYIEKRNVYEDFKNLFGKEIQFIDTVALMTDTDNSDGVVKTYYGDIYFSEN